MAAHKVIWSASESHWEATNSLNVGWWAKTMTEQPLKPVQSLDAFGELLDISHYTELFNIITTDKSRQVNKRRVWSERKQSSRADASRAIGWLKKSLQKDDLWTHWYAQKCLKNQRCFSLSSSLRKEVDLRAIDWLVAARHFSQWHLVAPLCHLWW